MRENPRATATFTASTYDEALSTANEIFERLFAPHDYAITTFEMSPRVLRFGEVGPTEWNIETAAELRSAPTDS